MVGLVGMNGLVRNVLTAALFTSVSATAQADNTVVVELYTSQGCSSCPAADKILKNLANRPGIIALSLNVDYWDYLGWKDDLALPGNSIRQRKYAKIMRSRHVYTPQLMVEGKTDVVGSRRSDVDKAVESSARLTDDAQVEAEVAGDRVNVTISPRSSAQRNAVIWLVGYDTSVTKAVGGGENHGRSIEYSNVVREWREAARWDGVSPLSFTITRPAGQSGVAIIVQEDGVGPILGATQVSY